MFVQAHVAGSDMAGTSDTCQTVSRRFRFRAGPPPVPPRPPDSLDPVPRPRAPAAGPVSNPRLAASQTRPGFFLSSPQPLPSSWLLFSLPPSNQKKCQASKKERKKKNREGLKEKERLISFRSRLRELNALDGCFLAEIQC